MHPGPGTRQAGDRAEVDERLGVGQRRGCLVGRATPVVHGLGRGAERRRLRVVAGEVGEQRARIGRVDRLHGVRHPQVEVGPRGRRHLALHRVAHERVGELVGELRSSTASSSPLETSASTPDETSDSVASAASCRTRSSTRCPAIATSSAMRRTPNVRRPSRPPTTSRMLSGTTALSTGPCTDQPSSPRARTPDPTRCRQSSPTKKGLPRLRSASVCATARSSASSSWPVASATRATTSATSSPPTRIPVTLSKRRSPAKRRRKRVA